VALGDDVDDGISDTKHVIVRHQFMSPPKNYRLSATPGAGGSSGLMRLCLVDNAAIRRMSA
ncbi:hypothetical protein NKH70_28235, partial [Mesorhizobium sp. M0991]|uniref:hypothetical protein n=1 Tax=Mesorhizobium sp. M0991 TaxID=2957043 RepID=UPI0033384C8C